MVTHRTADQHNVAVTNPVQPKVHTGILVTNTGGCEIQTAAFSASQNLGITCNDLDARVICSPGQAADNAVQLSDFQTFFNKCIQTQVLWNGSRDGEVVGGAMNRQ